MVRPLNRTRLASGRRREPWHARQTTGPRKRTSASRRFSLSVVANSCSSSPITPANLCCSSPRSSLLGIRLRTIRSEASNRPVRVRQKSLAGCLELLSTADGERLSTERPRPQSSDGPRSGTTSSGSNSSRTQSVAFGTGTVRAVEAERPRLDFVDRGTAAGTGENRAEPFVSSRSVRFAARIHIARGHQSGTVPDRRLQDSANRDCTVGRIAIRSTTSSIS